MENQNKSSVNDKLILLKRINPTEFEIHRGEIRQKANLVFTTTDKEFAERLVDGYNEQQCANESLLREAIFLLTLKQPDNCPNWKCGVGDCNSPDCEFCRIQRCINELEALLNQKNI